MALDFTILQLSLRNLEKIPDCTAMIFRYLLSKDAGLAPAGGEQYDTTGRQCSICQKSSGGSSAEFLIFSFQNSAFWCIFSYVNSQVLLAIKWRERYVFLATDGDTDMKMSSFHQSRKLIPIQSVSSNSHRFDRSQMQQACVIDLKSFYTSCKRKLHCRAVACRGLNRPLSRM